MADKEQNHISAQGLLEMTTQIVSAYATKNPVETGALPGLIKSVHQTLTQLSEADSKQQARPKPAVPVSRSVTQDHIICLEDGRKLKMLKRYLKSRYGMSPEEYRERWNLPADYPMVAPNYAKQRSQFAKQIGLGKSKKPGN